MSEKPSIYGFCQAGCKWETVHKEDFLNAFPLIEQNLTNGSLVLEKDKYRIYRADEATSWGFTIKVYYNYSSYSDSKTITLPTFDKYVNYLDFNLLGFGTNVDSTHGTTYVECVYEINGTRTTLKEGIGSGLPTVTVSVKCEGANKICLFNDGETIVKVEDVSAKLDNETIVLNKYNKIALNEKYANYLKNATLDIPVLTLLTENTLSVEYGKTVNVVLKHKETNVDNINGKITLLKNGVATSTTYDKQIDLTQFYTESLVVTAQTKYQTKCTDTLGNTRQSAEITFNCFYPSYLKATTATSISDITDSTYIGGSIKGTRSITTIEGQYVYFVTVETINKITSGGFDVPFEQESNINVTLNSKTVSYKVYRTSNALLDGVNNFDIS